MEEPGRLRRTIEVKIIDGSWTFLIPQQFLADSGVDYSIHSSFIVSADGTVGAGGDEGWF